MDPKDIAAEIRRLDEAWRAASPHPLVPDGRRAAHALATFVAEHRDEIIAKLES